MRAAASVQRDPRPHRVAMSYDGCRCDDIGLPEAMIKVTFSDDPHTGAMQAMPCGVPLTSSSAVLRRGLNLTHDGD